MKSKIIALVIATLIVMAGSAMAAYDVELRNLEVTNNNVCQGDTVKMQVTVEATCHAEGAKLYWYVDDELVGSESVSYGLSDVKTVEKTISTKGLGVGEHKVTVVAETACCASDSLSTEFKIKESGKLYDISLAKPKISMSKIAKGCCSDDLKVEATISSVDYDGFDTFGVNMILYVYDNPEMEGDYIYKDSKAVTMGSDAQRTAIFLFNPCYLDGGKYYFFVEATEREGVCSNTFSETSGYSVLDVACSDCGIASNGGKTSNDSNANLDDNGNSAPSAYGKPSISTIAIYVLLALIVIIVVLIVLRLVLGTSGSNEPV